MTNSLPWWRHGPNRNRWFTELKHVDLSMAMFNNQMIYIYIISTHGMSQNWATQKYGWPGLKHFFSKIGPSPLVLGF